MRTVCYESLHILFYLLATTTVQVVFSPDETEHYEVVPTTDDRVHEVDGHLTASLKGGDGVRIEDGVATATVIDDDGNC